MNKFHEKDGRLYQVMEHQQYAGEIMTTTSTPGILSENLKADYPEVEFATTTTWTKDQRNKHQESPRFIVSQHSPVALQ